MLEILEGNSIEKEKTGMIDGVPILYLASNRDHGERPSFAWVVEYE